jgi:hypothetical protein
VYNWDSSYRKDSSESINVQVKANSKKKVEYVLSYKEGRPVTLLEINTNDDDVKTQDSYLNIRYVDENIPGARINFPSIINFPIKKGEAIDSFMCAHGITSDVSDSKLTLEVLDRNENILLKREYVGTVTGDMMGFKTESKIAGSNIEYIKVKSKLEYNGNKLEDEVVYDCESSPSICNQSILGNNTLVDEDLNSGFKMKYLYLFLILIFAVTFSYFFIRVIKNKN